MSEVQRFWSHEASNIRCVREADFDRVTAERDAALGREASEIDLRRKHAARIHELSDQVKDMQQRLTAADELVCERTASLLECGTRRKALEQRVDVLVGLVGEVLDAVGREPLDLDAVLRLRARMRAALKPAEGGGDA